ncbi:MAG: sodium:solute symporter [Candidatus Delongbacteria bacterium]|nr:sodium:solute symporter [Candidatus Delongbacteria bacterium]
MLESVSLFSVFDWLVVISFLAILITVGIRAGSQQKNVKDYFLGGRNMPWWAVGVSIVAAETSALTFIGVPAMSYAQNGDLSYIQILIGYVLARIVLAVVMVPHYFKGEIFSAYQLLKDRFGNSPLILSSAFFLIGGSLAAGVRVYVTAIPLKHLLDVDIIVAILVFVAISIFYTIKGGVKSVIWTDFLQFFIFVGGGIFVLFYIPTAMSDMSMSTIVKEASEAGKLHWFHPQFSLKAPFNIWMGLIGATIGVMYSHGVDQLLVQKILTCNNTRDGRKALILSAALVFPLFVIFLLVGVLLFVFYQHHPIKLPIPINSQGAPQNDHVFPIFILTEAPIFLKGFLIAGILSAALSSISGAISALSSIWTMEFYKRFINTTRSEAFYLKYSRWMIVFFGAVLIAIAFMSQNVELVFNLAFSLAGLTAGAMLGAVLLSLMVKHWNPKPVIAGMLTSFAVMSVIVVMGQMGKLSIFWPWYPVIGSAVMMITSYIVNRLFFADQAE